MLLPYAPGVRPRPDAPILSLVCGGDRATVEAVLADRRLAPLVSVRHPYLLDTAEPRLEILRDAVTTARRVRIHLMP